MLEQFEKNGTDFFDAPIPGESLTSDPNTPKPWERPPEFTEVNPAMQELFMLLTAGGTYEDILDGLRNKVPIDMIGQTVLFRGYMLGKWNVDLMLLLMEPLAYLLIALAEQNGIYDYLLYAEEEEEIDEEEATRILKEDTERMRKRSIPTRRPIEQVLPSSLLSQIKETPAIGMGE